MHKKVFTKQENNKSPQLYLLALNILIYSIISFSGLAFAQSERAEQTPAIKDQLREQYTERDFEMFLEREKNEKIFQSSELVYSTAATDVLVNNNNGSTGTANFTQSETSIIAFGNNVLIGFNDSGSYVGGANKFTGFSYSTNSGTTFIDGGTLPTNAGGDAGDPVLARNETTGRIYFSTLGFSLTTIQVFRSDDNGLSWLAPVNGTPGGSSEDKQWITVDNYPGSGNGNVYLMSRRFGGPQGIYFFRSTDNGNTFGPAGGTLIVSNNQGAFVAVGPDHSVYAFWYEGSTGTIKMRKSTDLGVSFGATITVVSGLVGGTNGDLGLTGLRQGTATYNSFRSNQFPHAAINPVSGHIYITFDNDAAGSDKADIFMVTSTNGGTTWSAASRINDDATTTDQWMPTIAVTPNGSHLGIFYYSRQEDVANNNLFKYYGRIGSISGSTVNFDASFAISDVASLPEFGRDNVVNSVYMGDYNHASATASPTKFHVVWSDNRDDLAGGAPRKDPNVYYEAIPVGPPPATLPYSQVFDASTFPEYWTQTSTISPRWVVANSNLAGGTAYEMRADWVTGVGTSRLIVGPLNTTGLTNLVLLFKHFYDDWGTSNVTMKIQSSLDGITWTNEAFSFNSGGGNIGPETIFTTIQNNLGSTTYVAWVIDGDHFELDNWYIDDVLISPPLANDAGTVSIDFDYVNPGNYIPKATVKNFGTSTNSFNVQMTISGGYSSIKAVNSLAPGAMQQVNFDNWNVSTIGNYTVDVCTQLGSDPNPTNNCQTKEITVTNWMTGNVIPQATYLGGGIGYTSTTESSTGYLFSIGGYTNSGLNSECYKYNTATNIWSPIASLPEGRAVFASALVGDNIYVVGGQDNFGAFQSTVFRYDINANTWSTVAPIPAVFGWNKAVAYNGLIYVAGGFDGLSVSSSIFVYNISTNTWTTATSMPAPRAGGAYSIVGNKIIYVGGADISLIYNTVFVGTIDVADPNIITWSTMSNPYPGLNSYAYVQNSESLLNPFSKRSRAINLNEATPYPPGTMYKFDAAPWGLNGIIVAGGDADGSWLPANPNPCYYYNPYTDIWTAKENLILPVFGASLGSLKNGNNWTLINATGYSSFGTIDATQFYTETITENTFQLSVSVNNGWNMVSVPGMHPTDQNINTWWAFRDLGANVFKYAGGYTGVTTAIPGIGYWMKHAGARTYNTGDEWPAGGIQILAHTPLAGASGWNLFGGYELSVTAANVTTNPPGLQSGPIYRYSGGYAVATTLDPGYGYWIKLNAAGQIIIPETIAKGEMVEYFPEDWGRIILTDAAGINYTLYAVKGETDLSQYELPPAPPTGMFDIRYSSGRIAEDINSSVKTIDMSGVTYPLTVRVKNMDIRLMDETGKTINVNLKAGEDIVISDASIMKLMVSGELIPAKYALEQNYPNPFNPSTVIEFSLPEDVSNVKLSIYNALGEKVAELVNTALTAGKYQYQWNAQDVATGMYVYELRTDKFVSVKKMVLLK